MNKYKYILAILGTFLVLIIIVYKYYNKPAVSINIHDQCAKIDDLIKGEKYNIAINIVDSLIKTKQPIDPSSTISRKGKKIAFADLIWLRAYAKSEIKNQK